MPRFRITAAALATFAVAISAPISTPEHIRLTFSGNASRLSVGWGSRESPVGLSMIAWGPARVAAPDLPFRRTGSGHSYASDLCPNSTRAVHVAELDTSPGEAFFYAVSSDGGATWSEVVSASSPDGAYPQVVALFGDLGVEGLSAPLTSTAQIARDAAAGKHSHSMLIGDSAYNMDDNCSAVGDAFLAQVQPFTSVVPHVWGNGNHETGPDKKYSEFVNRLGAAQESAANASGSPSSRYMAWSVGRATYISIDADAWVYPLVWELAKPQWLWLNATLAAVDRSVTPWVVLYTHRAMYCTKVLDDGECISEAASLRDGLFLGTLWGLEALLLEYSVDLVFAGHTHHYERTWPVAKSVATATNYVSPRAPVHVQTGISGVDGNDPFDAPQQPWEAFRDVTFRPSYTRLTLLNDTHAHVEQLHAANGTVFDAFTIEGATHRGFASRAGL